jgi:hypothetical protein
MRRATLTILILFWPVPLALAGAAPRIEPEGVVRGDACVKAIVLTDLSARRVWLRAESREPVPAELIDRTATTKFWQAKCMPRSLRDGGLVRARAKNAAGDASSRAVTLRR